MSALDAAVLTTACAGLITALAQWFRLFGPRRNGRKAVIRYFEARLAATEAALADCLERTSPRHRTQPGRWRRPNPFVQNPVLSRVEGPVLSSLEGPVLSTVEGLRPLPPLHRLRRRGGQGVRFILSMHTTRATKGNCDHEP